MSDFKSLPLPHILVLIYEYTTKRHPIKNFEEQKKVEQESRLVNDSFKKFHLMDQGISISITQYFNMLNSQQSLTIDWFLIVQSENDVRDDQ